MSYVKSQGDSGITYPYSISKLKLDNPNTSFPREMNDQVLASYGVYPVSIEDAPSYDAKTEKTVLDSVPTETSGSWSLGWSVVSLAQSEMDRESEREAEAMRRRRNSWLAETDWWALQDHTMTQAQTDYRQALRDITSHADWPNLEPNDWPVKP